ncbi:glycosyltransferase family 61 protein [Methylobacterium sp. J-088]|uniref:glycosyltransferase family 61 protein n=1 Tax=Methylobacterium sp. J-088 TaxID=2836664 RepID=UPI001FBB0E7F|nr:glycosyltransferase family 61 protein [Methylobacterium sp. J-088]MCJ2064320.1 glycosyltransferase family 61 protein [Methylobacterium sp. J-088]
MLIATSLKRRFGPLRPSKLASTSTLTCAQLIKDSGLFDPTWYRSQYLTDNPSEDECIVHYLNHGASAGLFPNPLFDTAWYVSTYRIASRSGNNALCDFIVNTNALKRDPNPYFSTQFYLGAYPDIGSHPDILANKSSALLHYLRWGAAEGRETGPAFWSERYNMAYPDVVGSGLSAVAHYIHIGSKQGRRRFVYQQAGRKGFGFFFGSIPRSVTNILFVVSIIYLTASARLRRSGQAVLRDLTVGDIRDVVSVVLREPLVFSAFSKLHFFSFLADEDLGNAHLTRCYKDPTSGLRLFAASCCKELGLFEIADAVLRDLIASGRLADLARFSLADLALLRAIWAKEFQIYESVGTYIRLPNTSIQKRDTAWQQARFSDVLELLDTPPYYPRDDKESWLLLIYALFRTESWQELFDEIESYSKANGFSECLVKPLAATVNAIPARELRADTAVIKPILSNLLRLNKYHLDQAQEINPPDTSRRRLIDAPADLLLRYTLIHRAQRTSVDRRVAFEATYLSIGSDCTIIPQNGVVISDDGSLMRSSTHMQPMHYDLFSPDLIAASHASVLLGATARPTVRYEMGCVIGFSSNYYHWMAEDVSRIRSLRMSAEFEDLPIFVDKKIKAWQLAILERLGINDGRLVRVDPDSYLKVKRLVIPPRASRNMLVHPNDTRFLRESFTPAGGYPAPTRGKRLYLSRSRNTVQRAFINERLVMRELHKYGFVAVDPSEYSIEDQVRLCSDAEIIAAPGGAALTNILFASSQAKILVFAADAAIGETWSTIAAALDQDLILCTGRSYARPHHHLLWSRFAFAVDTVDLELALEALGL